MDVGVVGVEAVGEAGLEDRGGGVQRAAPLRMAGKEAGAVVAEVELDVDRGAGLGAKAKQQAKEGEVILESQFRYPGPKPQSKEAGLILLAATRSHRLS